MLIALLAVQPVWAQELATIPLQPAPAMTQPASSPGVLPRGTEVTLVLIDTLSSATAKNGQAVRFAVAQDLAVNGIVVVPRGTPAEGIVTHVRKGIPGKQNGSLRIEPRELLLNDGTRLKLSRNLPGEDDCGDMGPCWALATFAVALSPVFVAVAVVDSPWLIHQWIEERKKSPHTRPKIAGDDETLRPCEFNSAYTASRLSTLNGPATPQQVSDLATLEQLANCPAH
jgi:hypothetical protein